MLYPFVRHGLDVLFVGLNPANQSSNKGHYFSTNPAFWNQLFDSGLITRPVNMNVADDQVFGSTSINANHWEFGITDLVNFHAESNSTKVNPTTENCIELMQTIIEFEPKIVVLLHSKVIKSFVEKYIGRRCTKYGNLGQLINGCKTVFFNVPFPHGNAITSDVKVKLYRQIKDTLKSWNDLI